MFGYSLADAANQGQRLSAARHLQLVLDMGVAVIVP